MSKGSKQRPRAIELAELHRRWQETFKKAKEAEAQKEKGDE